MKYPAHKYNSPVSRELKNEVATRDATFYISMLNALPNPDPILRKTGNRIQVYRELSADWEVFAAIELIHSGLKDLEWEMNQNDATEEQLGFIEDLVNNWDPYDIMTQCIDARGFGYQPFENIWKSWDKKWIIENIVSKPPEWFNYSTKNELQFISKEHPNGKKIEDPRKFIVARNRPSYHNPYGESHYSRCFWPVTFKKGGISFWVKFLEKYGMPWLVGKQPRGTGDKETNKLLTDLHQMVQDAVAVIPDDSSVETLDASSRTGSTDSYMKFIEYCDKVINKVWLSNEMSMGTSSGSNTSDVRGNAGQNYQVSKQVIKSVASMAMYVINEAIKMVWAVNFTGTPPEISIYEPKDVQKPLAERDKILGESGVKFTRKYFKDNYALADDDFELVEKKDPEPPSPPEQPAAQPPDPEPEPDPTEEDDFQQHHPQCFCAACRVAKFKKFKEATVQTFQDPIEENSNAGLKELEKLIEASGGEESAEEIQAMFEEQLKPMIELINRAESYEEVMTSLATAYPEMNTEDLEDRIAKAYFIADILGRITEQENQEIEE